MKKIIFRIIPIVIVAMMVFVGNVYAANNGQQQNNTPVNPDVGSFDPLNSKAEGNVATVDTAVQKVWSTVLTILQVCAVAALVFAGVKYMFASAEGKADIKNGMIGLVVGAILVFGASTVIKWIVAASKDVIKV